MQTAQQNAKKRIFYGWYVFAVCFLMVFTALGFPNSSLYLAAITEDLEIPRSLFSMRDSCRFLTTATFNFFFGFLVVKYGPRRLICFGFLSLIAALLIYSVADSIFLFCLGGCLVGMGLSWTTTTMVGYLVERWFAGNKGTIMGIILAANGLGGAIATQFINHMLYAEGTVSGWRMSYRLTAILLAVVGVIVVLVVRNRPEEMGLQPMGQRWSTKNHKRGEQWIGISLKEATKKPYFYIALLCVYLTGMMLQSVGGVSSAHMKDCGIDPNAIAAILSIHSLVLMASKMSAGFCFDRFGLRATLTFCYVCGVIAITSLALVSNNVMAGIYSVVSSFALPLETIMLPLIAMDLFGHHSYSQIMGIFVSVNVFGYATGAPLMNLMYDLTGTYRTTMLFMAGLMVAVAITMQLVITAARKGRAASSKSCSGM